jgi:hypothetical protein
MNMNQASCSIQEQNSVNTTERKERVKARNLASFEAEYPQVAAWWTGSTFEFALSLRAFAEKNGYLTEGQLKAALKCVEKFSAATQARAVMLAAAPVVDVSKVVLCLNKAKQTLMYPKMRLLGNESAFEFSLAPAFGKNAGAVYVKQGETYLGKIADGRFQKSRDCTNELETDVLQACNDPEQAAIAFGRKFGNCSCCGRLLTNAESIEYGIGPICREKYFM